MINITIADDHPLMREGIKKIITDEVNISVNGEAKNGEQLLELLEAKVPPSAMNCR